jgi:hypothetical protein
MVSVKSVAIANHVYVAREVRLAAVVLELSCSRSKATI